MTCLQPVVNELSLHTRAKHWLPNSSWYLTFYSTLKKLQLKKCPSLQENLLEWAPFATKGGKLSFAILGQERKAPVPSVCTVLCRWKARGWGSCSRRWRRQKCWRWSCRCWRQRGSGCPWWKRSSWMFCSFSSSSETWYSGRAALGLSTGVCGPFQTENMPIPSMRYKSLFSRTEFYICVPWDLPGACRKLLDPFEWLSKSLEVSLELNLQAHYPLNQNWGQMRKTKEWVFRKIPEYVFFLLEQDLTC